MKASLRIGTRGSPLALAQSSMIRDQLASFWPDHHFELLTIKTSGDFMQDSPFKPLESTKAIFTKEIEEALLEKRIDLAIHSAKDLAAYMPDGLCLGAVPIRELAADALLLKPGLTLEEARSGLALTGSARRRRQWLDLNPGSKVEPVRGNIDTRLRKLLEHPDASCLILALAGIRRLKPDLHECKLLDLAPDLMIPAPGQGTLAVQCRSNDASILDLLKPLHHHESSLTLRAERALLTAMNAGCSIPLGATAWVVESSLHMIACYYASEQSSVWRQSLTGSIDHPEALGEQLAAELLKNSR
ncbi:MAG: hydroxymethylbilane synthase [Blastochloris sp.]|nr:hydroxymethylbilane synthase [Blastochloris sp.]